MEIVKAEELEQEDSGLTNTPEFLAVKKMIEQDQAARFGLAMDPLAVPQGTEESEADEIKNFERQIKKRHGFVRLYRDIIKSSIFTDPELFRLYIYCLARANFEDTKIIFDGKPMIIKRGQFITSLEGLGKDLSGKARKHGKISRKIIRRQIGTLERAHKLAHKGTNRYSLITVLNYDFWNSGGPANGTTKRDSIEPAAGQLRATDKNYNNLNKLKKEKKEKKFLVEEFLTGNKKTNFESKPDWWKYKLTSPSKIEKVLASFYLFEGAQFQNEFEFKRIMQEDAEKYQNALAEIIRHDYAEILRTMQNLEGVNALTIGKVAEVLATQRPDERAASRALADRFSV